MKIEEVSVQELVEIIGGAQSGISRHLAVLKSAGLIKDRKEGTWCYYSINNNEIETEKELFSYIENSFNNKISFKNDIEKLKIVIDKRKELSKNFFDKSARNYDELVKNYEDEKIRILSLLRLVPEKLNIIDLGCGTGLFLPFLGAINANIAAVDLSESMLNLAKEKMTGYSNIRFHNCDIRNIKDLESWADACFLNMVLHHIDKPYELFNDINKYLKINGRLIITDFEIHNDEDMRNKYGDLWLGFEENKIINWINESGFKDVSMQKLEMYNKDVFIISAVKIN